MMKPDTVPSKEAFIERIGALADEMTDAYDRDFAMGALILSARFIAQAQPQNNSIDASLATTVAPAVPGI